MKWLLWYLIAIWLLGCLGIFGYGVMFRHFGYGMMFGHFGYHMGKGWCYMFLGCFAYILMLCWGHMHFRCLDNSYFVGDGIRDALDIVVGCMVCFDCGFVCLWVGHFVG